MKKIILAILGVFLTILGLILLKDYPVWGVAMALIGLYLLLRVFKPTWLAKFFGPQDSSQADEDEESKDNDEAKL